MKPENLKPIFPCSWPFSERKEREREREEENEVGSEIVKVYEKGGMESTQCGRARNEESQSGTVGVGRFYRGYASPFERRTHTHTHINTQDYVTEE